MLNGGFDVVLKGINQQLRGIRTEFSTMQDHLDTMDQRLSVLEKGTVSLTQLDEEVSVLVPPLEYTESQ